MSFGIVMFMLFWLVEWKITEDFWFSLAIAVVMYLLMRFVNIWNKE